MDLKKLKKVIPHKWRVQSTNQYGSQCVAYVDARDVQDLLDDVCGSEYWQCKFEEHKGNLFCSIGINISKGDDTEVVSQWVWKSDCGTESNIEKQKGESSDAFKRAAVMWGVGRFLYSKKIIKIKEVIESNGKYFPAQNGNRIWDINAYCNGLSQPRAEKDIPKPKRLSKAQLDLIPQSMELDSLKTVLKTYSLSDNEKKIVNDRIKILEK